MKYTVEELRKLAEEDQGKLHDRPWTYTDRCQMCGGVKAFIDWLEKRVV